LGREHFKQRIIAKEKGKQIYLNKQTNKKWVCHNYGLALFTFQSILRKKEEEL